MGSVFRKGVLCRPSQVVRSPYVADIRQSPFEASPFVSLLRTEGARMTAKEKKERKASIDALVADLKAEDECGGEMAHAPSLDCAGMLVMGSNAYVTRNSGATTKTAWTVQLCEEERGGKEPNVIVGYHPALAEKIAKSMLLHEDLPLRDELGEIEEIASQRTFKNSRVDFVIKGKDNTLTLLEVKNVVGAEYEEGTVPPTRSPVGVYEVSAADLPAPGERHAIFPHGSLKPGIGVVSDRAIKHVHELGELEGTIDADSGRKIKTAVLFIVNRGDTTAFRPAHEACPMFAQCLKAAQKRGTKLIAREVRWELEEGEDGGFSARALAGASLPVTFHPSVSEELDQEHLLRVLKYNAEVPKTRSPRRTPVKKKRALEPRKKEADGGANGVRRSARKKAKM